VNTFSGRRNVERCRIASGISDWMPGLHGPDADAASATAPLVSLIPVSLSSFR
jgi:hypothetical protein